MNAGSNATAVRQSDRRAMGGLTNCLPCGLLLSSLGDGGYVIPPRRLLSAGLAASALVELAFRDRIGVDGGRLLVTDRTATGDAVVDPTLEFLTTRRRAPDAGRCLEQLSLDWTILGRAEGALEARGIVRVERRALHPLIMHRFHPLPPSRAAALRAALRAVLDGTSVEAGPRDGALAALAEATGILRRGPRGLAEASTTRSTPPGQLGASEPQRVLAALKQALAPAA